MDPQRLAEIARRHDLELIVQKLYTFRRYQDHRPYLDKALPEAGVGSPHAFRPHPDRARTFQVAGQ